MKPEDIHLNDWARILVGDVPRFFFIELFFRALFFYAVIIFSMRLLGKRMASQLSRNELASLVALAASVGIPLMAPDRGIIPGFISCMVIVGVSRLLSTWFTKSEKMEQISQGYPTELVTDGFLKIAALESAHLSRDRVLSQLRSEGVKQLGKVKRLYFEENGRFTMIKDPDRKSGLNILPEEDGDFANQQKKVADSYVCENCGKAKPMAGKECENCGSTQFTEAISEE